MLPLFNKGYNAIKWLRTFNIFFLWTIPWNDLFLPPGSTILHQRSQEEPTPSLSSMKGHSSVYSIGRTNNQRSLTETP